MRKLFAHISNCDYAHSKLLPCHYLNCKESRRVSRRIQIWFVVNQTSAHLAAGQLAEMWFQVLSDHCVDGHQAEHTGFPHTALRVVVALFDEI